jgi:hypothetical protein
MEPRQEEQKDKVTRTEEKEAKPRRFRIVKLEERIAPRGGNHGTHEGCTFACCAKGYPTC